MVEHACMLDVMLRVDNRYLSSYLSVATWCLWESCIRHFVLHCVKCVHVRRIKYCVKQYKTGDCVRMLSLYIMFMFLVSGLEKNERGELPLEGHLLWFIIVFEQLVLEVMQDSKT